MKNLHHANIFLGDSTKSIYQILEEDLELTLKANPDFFLYEAESFGIGEARNLEKWAINKPFIGEIKAALIIVGNINWEAQNTLLKLLEEPPLGTYFFIKLPNLSGLLPTFLSRVRVLDERGEEQVQKNAKGFLHGSIKERLDLARVLAKKEDKTDIKDLIKSLESIAYQDKSNADRMKKILTAKVFASVRGGSPRMLLEWLSCVI